MAEHHLDMAKIRAAIPKEKEGPGRKSMIRQRSDIGEIVCDLVLQRRTQADIARRIGVDYTTLQRFKQAFVPDSLAKLIVAESTRVASVDIDAKINAGQDDIQSGLQGVIKEQKDLYKMIREKVSAAEGGRDIEDVLPALSQLLRDQGQSYERLLKSYTALKDKTTIIVPINEAPEWSQLQEVLYDVFEQHPDAFAMFRDLVNERGLRLG